MARDNKQVRLNTNIQPDHWKKVKKSEKKIKYFHFSIDILLYKVVYYIQTKKTGGKPNESTDCKEV